MRVIAGIAKGKTLEAVPGDSTRPILDRVKTALFDILRPQIPGLKLLDLFAGSGAVGIEALSQGAKHCTFLDLDNQAFQTIKKNIAHTGFADNSSVFHTDAFSFLKRTKECFDLIYVAPPQFKNIWIEALQEISAHPEIMKPTTLVIAQIDPKEYEQLTLNNLQEFRKERYGNTELVFYKAIL